MSKTGSKQHEALLKKTIDQLKSDGYRVVNLEGKSPDAIAVKDDKIIAVEILGKTWTKKKGWHKSWTHRQKIQNYNMFDDLIIKEFSRNSKLKR